MHLRDVDVDWNQLEFWKNAVFRSPNFYKWTNYSPINFQIINKIKRARLNRGGILDQKIKQDKDGSIGKNIREIRMKRGMGQTELVRLLDLQGIPITRECLVKIERGIQHIQVQQLRAIKNELKTSYDELLK